MRSLVRVSNGNKPAKTPSRSEVHNMEIFSKVEFIRSLISLGLMAISVAFAMELVYLTGENIAENEASQVMFGMAIIRAQFFLVARRFQLKRHEFVTYWAMRKCH